MKTTITKSVISLFAIALIIIRIRWPDIKIDTITIGLIIIALLPWVAVFLESAELPGGWKLKFKEIKKEQVKQKNEIDSITRFLANHFLTESELRHLHKLSNNLPFPFIKSPETPFFEKELRRLRSLGIIAGHPGKGVRSLLKQGGDVKEHFFITKNGLRYLRMRAELDELDKSNFEQN